MEQRKSKIKPELKVADDFLDLRTMDTNIIIGQLEENIRLRELSLEKQIKQKKRL